jgi:hypothetical protein
MNHWFNFSTDLILAGLGAFLIKVWGISSSYILTHYIIGGVMARFNEWLKSHPIEHAIVAHYEDKHKKINPVYRSPKVCEIEKCTELMPSPFCPMMSEDSTPTN